MDGCDLNVHLISPARSMPFGSERSHFAHSPHLLASLILLNPPEIGGELKRKGQEQELLAGLLLRRVPGDLTEPGRTGALAFPALPAGGRWWEICKARARGARRVWLVQGVPVVLEGKTGP